MNGIIDAHHHLWDPRVRADEWLREPGLESLNRPFVFADLIHETTAAGVEGTVAVQTINDAAETLDLLATADGSRGVIAGVVGWVDLTSVGLTETLAELCGRPGGSRLVGIRHLVESEPGSDWLQRRDIARGIAAVGRAGLVYDLLIRADQLPAATLLASELADVRFVLDHGAKPPAGSANWERWASDLGELARRDNVVCKLSGLFTLLPPGAATEELEASVDVLFTAFGAGRLMFGTDWPVSTLAAAYGDVVTRTCSFLGQYSAAERNAVLGDNARSTYRLAPVNQTHHP